MLLPQSRHYLPKFCVALLLITLVAELALSIRRETQTWDEACHLFAGYSYWTRADFGMNPEHPPLVKLLAALPLLPMSLRVPVLGDRNFKVEAFLSGEQFVYSNDAEVLRFRARLAAALLSMLLAGLVFLATREMFGGVPALIALTPLVFDPNLLAHGALVTTDVGLSCFLFAAVFAFYRHARKPSKGGILLLGLAAGCTLATKHSGVLVFPILALLALGAVIRGPATTLRSASPPQTHKKQALQLAVTLGGAGLVALCVLWAFYGFRFAARAHDLPMNPPLAEYARHVTSPTEARTILALARWHVLPEAYLYGLADVRMMANYSSTYLFGKVYPHGQWFYFPATFVIKTPLALMALLLLVPALLYWRWREKAREFWFLVMPPVCYFAVAMGTGLNIGVRHILPIYPFLFVLAGAAAGMLAQRNGRWQFAVGLLLLFNAFSSLRVFPTYLAYANELWGGPANTYRLLSDSNADWGQQLKSTKRYLDRHNVHECWFAYFAAVVADPAYYGIPCRPLTTIASVWLKPQIDVPASIDGTVLISASVLSGYEFGPDELNPYAQFQKLGPIAVIEHGIFVYQGHFEIPLASALNHLTRASLLEREKQYDEALAETRAAVVLAPESVATQAALGRLLMKTKQEPEARQALQRALQLAQTVHPEFRSGWISELRQALAAP